MTRVKPRVIVPVQHESAALERLERQVYTHTTHYNILDDERLAEPFIRPEWIQASTPIPNSYYAIWIIATIVGWIAIALIYATQGITL